MRPPPRSPSGHAPANGARRKHNLPYEECSLRQRLFACRQTGARCPAEKTARWECRAEVHCPRTRKEAADPSGLNGLENPGPTTLIPSMSAPFAAAALAAGAGTPPIPSPARSALKVIFDPKPNSRLPITADNAPAAATMPPCVGAWVDGSRLEARLPARSSLRALWPPFKSIVTPHRGPWLTHHHPGRECSGVVVTPGVDCDCDEGPSESRRVVSVPDAAQDQAHCEEAKRDDKKRGLRM